MLVPPRLGAVSLCRADDVEEYGAEPLDFGTSEGLAELIDAQRSQMAA